MQAFVPQWWYRRVNANTLIGAAILKSGHPWHLGSLLWAHSLSGFPAFSISQSVVGLLWQSSWRIYDTVFSFLEHTKITALRDMPNIWSWISWPIESMAHKQRHESSTWPGVNWQLTVSQLSHSQCLSAKGKQYELFAGYFWLARH